MFSSRGASTEHVYVMLPTPPPPQLHHDPPGLECRHGGHGRYISRINPLPTEPRPGAVARSSLLLLSGAAVNRTHGRGRS